METIYHLSSEYKIFFIALHVLSVVVAMGAALMSDILFSFYSRDKELSQTETQTLHILSNTVWFGLIFVTISGLGIFFSNVDAYLVSAKFLTKMTIVAVLLINGYILHRYISKSIVKKGFLKDSKFRFERMLSFACGAISITSWIWIFILGILTHIPFTYTNLISTYGAMIVVGVCVSLIVEKIKFN